MNKKQALFLILALTSTTGLSGPAFALSEQELAQTLSPQEKKIDQLRNAEIHQLQIVISRTGQGEHDPDLMLRLAELYTEKYKLYFFKESESWSKKMDEYLALPLQQQKYRKRPQPDTTSSRRWLTKAVEVLRDIPAQKANYSRIDEVYYFLGFNEWELGNKAAGVKAFEKIISSYPNSKFVSEAYRYVADQAFADRDFRKAANYYEKSAKQGPAPARPRVLYGLAWSKFKMQDYKSAVATMKQAIQEGRENADAAKTGLALQRDAAESLALFYSEGGNVDDATNYFIDVFGPDEGSVVLRKLSEFYQRQGKYPQALAINKQLLAMGGAAAKQGEEQRFEIMVASLNMAATRGDRDKQAALLKSMTTEFVTNAKDPAEDKVEVLRAQVRKAATLAHREGNKSNTGVQSHQRAADLYRLYLAAYGSRIKSEDAAEIHWYLADVYNQLGQNKEATNEYRLIIENAEKDPAYRKYSKDASAAMVYAMDGYFKNKGEQKKMSKADGDQVIASIDAFVKTYPNDKEAPKYLARASGILVTSGRMDEARPRLLELTEKYPKSREALDAAATLVKDAETRKDEDGAQQLAQTFLANGPLLSQDDKGTFRKSLETVIDRAKFQKTAKLEASKDYGAAAQQFEKTAAAARDPEVKMKALNNAAVNYGRNGDHDNEMRVYEQILAAHPDNEAAERAILGVANEHFLSGRYAAAADVYESFYRVHKAKLGSAKPATQKSALEALRSAALLRRALKDGEKAGEDFKDLVEAANKGLGAAREAAGEFLFDIARRQRDEGNVTEAIRSFQKYSSAFPDGPHAVGATMETAVLYEKLKEDEKAQAYYRTTISKVKGKGSKASPEELGYAARARLELLGPLEEAYERAPIRLPEKQMQADIKAKLAAMERLNKGYVEVMDFGDGQWGVEAFRRMALVYRNLGQKLENAPVPENFSPEEKAKFKAQLKNVAGPVYMKVGETLDTAIQKGEQLQVVTPAMANTYLLAAVNSARADRLPLIQSPDWSKPSEWIMGDQPAGEAAVEKHRQTLRNGKSDDPAAWIAIGNYHLNQGEAELAEIFYLNASRKNAKYPAALNNLAYLRGREGDLARAMGGFKGALAADEFAIVPKKNVTRLYMGAGLWRHASLNFRQLEVRLPNDREVKRGVALAALANGKTNGVDIATEGEGDNGKFAQAVLALGKGSREKAAAIFEDLAGHNDYAKLILDFWKTKENKE